MAFGNSQNPSNSKNSPETELERQIRKLNFVLEGAGLGSWDWNLETNEVAFDERWCTMIGLDPKTTPMQLDTWSSRVHPDDLAAAYRDVQAHVDGKTPSYENIHRMRHADGRWVWILDKGRVTERDSRGRALRFSGTHLDISLQKQVEQDLRDWRQRMELAIRTFDIGIWDWNILEDQLYWHASMYPIYGLQEQDGPGTYEMWRKALHPDDRESTEKAVADSVSEGRSLQIQFRIVRPDGEIRWIASRASVERDHEGKTRRLFGLNWDITEEREAQLELERQRMISIHASRLATLGEMAGGIAHEINTPLAIITTRASQLAELLEKETLDRELGRKITRTLEETAMRVARIVSSMKNFSRESSSDPMQVVGLTELVHDTSVIVLERFRWLGIQLDCAITPPDLSILCHPGEISQVLLNLLQNARDAIESLPEKWIRLDAEREGDEVVIRITDSGAGIPQTQRARLFEPFFTTKPTGKGTGLGLGICRRIIERHGGSIHYNEHSPHTQFVIRLPQGEQSK